MLATKGVQVWDWVAGAHLQFAKPLVREVTNLWVLIMSALFKSIDNSSYIYIYIYYNRATHNIFDEYIMRSIKSR